MSSLESSPEPVRKSLKASRGGNVSAGPVAISGVIVNHKHKQQAAAQTLKHVTPARVCIPFSPRLLQRITRLTRFAEET